MIRLIIEEILKYLFFIFVFLNDKINKTSHSIKQIEITIIPIKISLGIVLFEATIENENNSCIEIKE